MKRLRRQFILWTGFLVSTTLGFAQTSKIAPDLQSLLSNLLTPTNVVIQYNSTPGLLNVLKLLSLGGVINAQYVSIPAIAVQLPGAVVSLLALDPSVAYISPDRQVAGTLDLTTAAVNADVAFQAGYTGSGIGIAIVDSGIYAHPDLASRIVYRLTSGRSGPRSNTSTSRTSPRSSFRWGWTFICRSRRRIRSLRRK